MLSMLSWGALFACGGSALEGRAPDGPGDSDEVDAVDTVEETETSDATDTRDGEVAPDTDAVDTDDTSGGDTDDGEIDVGPVDWEPVSLGDAGVIDDLVLVSDELGFAASGDRVLRWDGALWAAYGEPGGVVHGVWADKDVVVAAGDSVWTKPTDDGEAAWVELAGAPTVTWRAVVARGADDVVVAGDDGTVAHWDGTAWATRFSSATIDLRALWLRPGTSGDEGVFAVGTGGQLVTTVDGNWKASQIAQSSVVLSDVSGLPDGTLVAVGDQHTITIKRPTGLAWQGQVSNDERQRDLAAIAIDGDVARLFGTSGAVLSGGGSGGWNVDTSANVAAGLKDFAVADAAGGRVMALASTGGGVARTGTTWATLATAPEASLTGFAAGPADTLWAVGSDGFLAVRTAQGWSAVDSGTTNDLHGIAADGDVLWAVGAKGTILRIANGAVASLASPVPIDLYAVAATPLGMLACGRGGTLVSIAEGVTLASTGTTADLRAIVAGGDGRVWVAGAFGTLLRLGTSLGATPEVIASGVGGSLMALASMTDGVLAVGDNGVVVAATAGGATLEHESPGAFLYGVATRADGLAIAAGANGLVLVREGGAWSTEVATEGGATFEAVWLGDDEALIGGVFRLMHVEERVTR